MGEITIVKEKYNKFIVYSIILFIIYVALTYIPDYLIGRKLKAILLYGSLFFSFFLSIIGIFNMLYKRKISIINLFLLSIPYIYILFVLFFTNCKKSENTFDYLDFSKLENSHEIVNKDLKDSLSIFLNNNFSEYDFEYPILILDIEKSEKEVIFHLCKTDFIVFKNYRNEYFKEPYGILNYNDLPLLLFGFYDDNFINTMHNFNNDKLLGDLPVYDRDNPPITYDPNFISFKIGKVSD